MLAEDATLLGKTLRAGTSDLSRARTLQVHSQMCLWLSRGRPNPQIPQISYSVPRFPSSTAFIESCRSFRFSGKIAPNIAELHCMITPPTSEAFFSLIRRQPSPTLRSHHRNPQILGARGARPLIISVAFGPTPRETGSRNLRADSKTALQLKKKSSKRKPKIHDCCTSNCPDRGLCEG